MQVNCLYDKLVPISELKPNPKNRNAHPQDQIERLAKILKYQGWRYPIKVSKRSGYITSGHGRLAAALLNAWDTVPVNYQDYESEEQEYADLQASNAITGHLDSETAAYAAATAAVACIQNSPLFSNLNKSGGPSPGSSSSSRGGGGIDPIVLQQVCNLAANSSSAPLQPPAQHQYRPPMQQQQPTKPSQLPPHMQHHMQQPPDHHLAPPHGYGDMPPHLQQQQQHVPPPANARSMRRRTSHLYRLWRRRCASGGAACGT